MQKMIKKYAVIVLGTAMMGFAVSRFYIPNKIVNGGVSGLSTILFYTLGIAPGLSYAVINVALLAAALRFLGSAFGAILYGAGIGLTLAEGASTGGTDILGRLLQTFFPHIKIGNLILVADTVVIGVSLAVFGRVELALYGILALMISSYTINWLIRKLNISKLAFVVTDCGEEVVKHLISNSARGVTVVRATGGYTMENKTVLMCALKENEAEGFQKRVLEKDASAFIIFSESTQIVGNGFRVYK